MAPLIVQGQQQHLVDQLLGLRTWEDGTHPEYLVRWQGCDATEDTWEPAENIDPVTLATFDNRYPACNAYAEDVTAMWKDCADQIPPPFSVQGNLVGKDVSI